MSHHGYGGGHMNMGYPDHGGAAPGAPVYGHVQHDYSHGGEHAMNTAAANDGHGQHDTEAKHANHHDHSHGGAHVLPAAAGAAAVAYGHGQQQHDPAMGGSTAAAVAVCGHGQQLKRELIQA
jgi:hypothetical protein